MKKQRWEEFFESLERLLLQRGLSSASGFSGGLASKVAKADSSSSSCRRPLTSNKTDLWGLTIVGGPRGGAGLKLEPLDDGQLLSLWHGGMLRDLNLGPSGWGGRRSLGWTHWTGRRTSSHSTSLKTESLGSFSAQGGQLESHFDKILNFLSKIFKTEPKYFLVFSRDLFFGLYFFRN